MMSFGWFVLSLCWVVARGHGVYIGMVDVYPAANHQQVVVTVFADDLENALFNELNDHSITAQNVKTYFKHHLEVKINNQLVELIMTNLEQTNEDTYRLFFEVESNTVWQNVAVKADFLMELFPTQNNIVRIHQQNTKYFSLTKRETWCAIVIN